MEYVAATAGVVLDEWCDRGHGDRPAAVVGDRGWTYADLLGLTCAAARGLTGLGLARGDRVLLLLDDGPEFVAVFLGAIRAGFVPVAASPAAGIDEHRHMLADSGAAAVVADAATPFDAGVPVVDPARLTADPGAFPPAASDDAAFLLYSSGSTGRAKGVVHRQRDLPATAATFGAHVLEVTAADRLFCTSKMFHAYGLCNNLIFPLWFGASVVFLPGRRDLNRVFDTIEAHRPTLLASVPSVYRALLAVPGARSRDLSSVRRATSAGEALPAGLLAEWRAAYGLEPLDGIGSTELLATFCSNRPGRVKPGSSGTPVPGFTVRLVADGAVVDGAGTGALQVAGDTAFSHYWNNPDRTRAVVDGPWVSTGDVYHRDADGCYTFQGRSDDMLKISGLWVSPTEIEDVLTEHDGVADAAVVGVRDDSDLTRLTAYVVPSGRDTDLVGSLRAWLRPRLPRHQYPRTIEVVTELPRTATGKIQRFRLRERD